MDSFLISVCSMGVINGAFPDGVSSVVPDPTEDVGEGGVLLQDAKVTSVARAIRTDSIRFIEFNLSAPMPENLPIGVFIFIIIQNFQICKTKIGQSCAKNGRILLSDETDKHFPITKGFRIFYKNN